MTIKLSLPQQNPDWPLIYAAASVKANMEDLIMVLYYDLAQGVQYRLVVNE